MMERGGEFWRSVGAELVGLEEVVAGDWLAEYRRHAAPFPLGRRFLVDPREPGSHVEDEAGRLLLRLPARQAFGTGSHESTGLVVEWLEDQDLAGERILDVGTGTGILAFVALHLGAHQVVAVEIDPVAAFMATINQTLNRMRFPLVIGGVAALGRRAQFDAAVVNVLPHRIAADLERIAALIRPGGVAIFSGLLDESSDEVSKRLESFGLVSRQRLRSGEWAAVVVEREVT
jgi:ribosomal protein L11 methyltransferase